jgi:hypothetical protein
MPRCLNMGMEAFGLFKRKSSNKQCEEIIGVAGKFISMSVTLAGQAIYQADNATGVLGFTYGVVDALCQRAGLNPAVTIEVLKRYLSVVYEGDETRIQNTLKLIPQISTGPRWAHSLDVGGQAVLQFLAKDGQDLSQCLRLSRMLVQ